MEPPDTLRCYCRMIAALISLLIGLLILGIIWWAVTRIFAVLPIAEPFRTVIYVVLVLIACLIVIYLLLGFLPPHYAPIWRY